MPKAQMHFEADVELKQHWKAFFATMPRGSESRVLVELMRNFLSLQKIKYEEAKEAEFGLEEKPLDSVGDRSGVVEQSGVEVSGGSSGPDPKYFPVSENAGE